MVKLDWEYHAFDIKNTFIELPIKENIWFKVVDRVIVKKGRALRALRSLYELK